MQLVLLYALQVFEVIGRKEPKAKVQTVWCWQFLVIFVPFCLFEVFFTFLGFANTRMFGPAVFLCFSSTPSLLYRLASVPNVSNVPFNLKRHASINGRGEG